MAETNGTVNVDRQKYTNNDSYIFSEAVPYYYGSGSPYYNYYLPLGEDNKVEVPENDIKVQICSGDVYTVTGSLDNFCIGGQPINYIKKGTFPKLCSENIQTDSNAEAIWQPDPLWQHNLTKTNEDSSKCTNFVIIGEFDKEKKLTSIKCKDLTTSSTSTSDVVTTTQLKEFYPNEFTDESPLPTRLGFVMTAGGGGGAGVNRIDTGSCSTGDDRYYPIPGGGGGGASTALGVLKFDCPEIVFRTVFLGGKYQSLLGVVGKIDGTDRDEFYPVVAPNNPTAYITKDQGISLEDLYVSSVRFHITGGCHGKGNGESSNRVEKSANDGSDGYDSAILVNFYLHSKDESSPDDNNKKYETSDGGTIRKVVTVCGGRGGKAATSTDDGIIYGGKGGIITDKYALKTSAFIYHLKSFAGGDGANITISGESGTPGNLSKYDLDLTSAYYNNIPETKEYRIEFSYAQEVGGVADEDKLTGCIYGGYSFGRGSRGTDMCAEFGGGGCCLKTKEGVKDENKAENPDSSQNNDNYQLNEPTNGADGYFALFY